MVRFDIYSLIVYILMSFVGFFSIRIAKRKEINKKVLTKLNLLPYAIWILIWTVFAGIRLVTIDGVGGADAYMYMSYFQNSLKGDISYLHFDIGYRALTVLIRTITSNERVFMFVCAFILVWSYALFIKEFCPKDINKIPLLLCFYIFLRGFTTYRTNLAVAALLIGLVLLKKEKYWISFIVMIFSVLLHKVSIVYVMILPFYLVFRKKKVTIKVALILLSLGIFFGYLLQKVMLGKFGVFLGDAYSSYAMRSLETSFFDGFWKIAFEQMLLGLLMLFLRKRLIKDINKSNPERNKQLNMIWNFCIFDFILIPCTYFLCLWRGYEYLYLPRLIMWGECLTVLLRLFDKQSRKYLNVVFILIFVSWLVFRIVSTYESSGLLPYIIDFTY